MCFIETETQASKFSIFDVVIPLLGRETENNALSTAYTKSLEVLAGEGLSVKDFEHHCER